MTDYNDVNEKNLKESKTYFQKIQKLSKKPKVYDFEKIQNYIIQHNFLSKNKNNGDLFFVFKTKNPKSNEFAENSSFIFDTGFGEYLTIYSINENRYLKRFEIQEIYSKNMKFDLLVYENFNLENIELPKKWLTFLTNHFEFTIGGKNQFTNTMIGYLCLQYSRIFTLLDNCSVLKKDGHLHVCCSVPPMSLSLTGENEYTKIFVDLPNYTLNLDGVTRSKLLDMYCFIYPNNSYSYDMPTDYGLSLFTDFLNIDIKDMNIFWCIKDTPFAEKQMKLILFKSLILGFLSCEFLFFPGINISRELVNIDLLAESEEKIEEYAKIVNEEYVLILAYIFSVITKYKKIIK